MVGTTFGNVPLNTEVRRRGRRSSLMMSRTTWWKTLSPDDEARVLDRTVYWLFRLTILLTRPLPLRLGYRVASAVAAVCYRTIFRAKGRALRANLAHVVAEGIRHKRSAVRPEG